ncbi:hypothetical protein ACFQ4Q_02050 [Lysobacter gummosus]
MAEHEGHVVRVVFAGEVVEPQRHGLAARLEAAAGVCVLLEPEVLELALVGGLVELMSQRRRARDRGFEILERFRRDALVLIEFIKTIAEFSADGFAGHKASVPGREGITRR